MGADLIVTGERIEGGEPVGDLIGPLRSAARDRRAARAGAEHDRRIPRPGGGRGLRHRASRRMRGLKELRVKESDRLAGTAALLAANGVRVEIEGDDLIVHGTGAPPPGGGMVATQMDHRMAMSGVVLGLAAAAPVAVDDVGFIDTSFPGFIALMNALGATLAPAGSG